MKILYIHTLSFDSEMANLTQVLNMCQAFAHCNCEVALAIPSYKSIDEKEAATLASEQLGAPVGFRILPVKCKPRYRRLNKFFLGTWLPSDLLRQKWDMCFLRSPAAVGTLVATGQPVVFESHNAVLNQGSKWVDWSLRRRLVGLSRRENFRALVGISEALANYWKEKGVPEEKVLAAHDGFDSNHTFGRNLSKAEVRSRYGIDPDENVVVYTGSLYRNRGIDRILRLAQDIPKAQFVVVGGPEGQRRYFEREVAATGLENIKFVGRVPHTEVADWLCAADVLLALWSGSVPTIKYCSPLKVFEYMAAERVIVADAFPTIREVLTHEKNALLVDPGNYTDLLEKTRRALSDNTVESLGKNAKELAFREYSWEKRAENILNEVFASLVPNKAVPYPRS